ncbi:MAG: hypothetical protein QM704_00675 [Anaeromyxobacteraceae bacterium]
MRTFPDVRFRKLNSEAQHAGRLLDDRRYAEAREAFTTARARARKLGLDSAYLAWGLAVALDMTEETEMAFKVIAESVAMDPLNPAAQHSFDTIAWKLRATLEDPDRAAGDPSTPRIYALLLEAGEADVAAHVAMARHLDATGDTAGALRLLDSVTRLAPVSRDAWAARARVARAAGDEALAAECDAQVAALGTARIPFAIPGERAAC